MLDEAIEFHNSSLCWELATVLSSMCQDGVGRGADDVDIQLLFYGVRTQKHDFRATTNKES